MAHFGNAAGIGTQAPQRGGEELALAGFDDDPAIMPPDEPRRSPRPAPQSR